MKIKYLYENLQVFIIGALLYSSIEILFRSYTHWTMFLTGGICVVVLYNIFLRTKKIELWKKCFIGAGVITLIEFLIGCVVNLHLDWNIWDYSRYHFNIAGQICLLFTLFWFILSAPMVWLTGQLKKITNSKLRF